MPWWEADALVRTSSRRLRWTALRAPVPTAGELRATGVDPVGLVTRVDVVPMPGAHLLSPEDPQVAAGIVADLISMHIGSLIGLSRSS